MRYMRREEKKKEGMRRGEERREKEREEKRKERWGRGGAFAHREYLGLLVIDSSAEAGLPRVRQFS